MCLNHSYMHAVVKLVSEMAAPCPAPALSFCRICPKPIPTLPLSHHLLLRLLHSLGCLKMIQRNPGLLSSLSQEVWLAFTSTHKKPKNKTRKDGASSRHIFPTQIPWLPFCFPQPQSRSLLLSSYLTDKQLEAEAP